MFVVLKKDQHSVCNNTATQTMQKPVASGLHE